LTAYKNKLRKENIIINVKIYLVIHLWSNLILRLDWITIIFWEVFMLTLGYFSKFPAAYKDREKSVKNVIFTNIQRDVTDDGKIIIHARTDKYQQEMEIQDNTIHLNHLLKYSALAKALNSNSATQFSSRKFTKCNSFY